MWQFILGSDAAFVALEARARRACVQFRDQQMPPRSDPARATIGIEVDPMSGAASLFVTRGVNYSGPNDEIRSWLSSGQRSFDSFTEFRSWIDTALRPAFTASAVTLRAAPGNPDTHVAEGSEGELDDVDAKALQLAMRNIRKRDDLPS